MTFTEEEQKNLREISARSLADRAALAAWDTPAGDVGRIVIQLRARGRSANRAGTLILSALIATVLLGLGYYILWPAYKDYVTGRRGAWEEVIKAQETVSGQLDARRAQILAKR